MQSLVSYKPNTSQSTTHTSEYSYIARGGQGVLDKVEIEDGRARTIYYGHNLQGEITGRNEFDYSVATTGDPHEIWYRFAGREIGYVSNNGTRETDYATSITNRTATQGSGAFFNGATSATPYGDFVQDASLINSYGQGGAGGAYVVRAGDTRSTRSASQLWRQH